jgi:hypothetical protein
MSAERAHDERDDWGAGWEAHRLHQLTLALAATPAQRLAWLEEMIAIAHASGALPRPGRAAGAGSSAPGRPAG